jgi:predicted ATPase
MTLELQNIGMIKEAKVNIDGLTVIAGENDTGKSTVGKALYLQFKSIAEPDNPDLVEQIFGENFIDSGKVSVSINNNSFINFFDNDQFYGKLEFYSNKERNEPSKKDFKTFHLVPIMIETPTVWNWAKFFNQLPRLERVERVIIDHPILMRELDDKFYVRKRKKVNFHSNKEQRIFEKILTDIENEIQGKFKMNGSYKKEFYFYKKLEKESKQDNDVKLENKVLATKEEEKESEQDNDEKYKRIHLDNTATGIKSFGILQILIDNNWLNENTILILDEPEVHLHPKWQLAMAKVIVDLVENGVKIIVNSHSPYMIDALKYYADKEQINNNFYLAQKNEDETSFITDVTMDVSPIFEKLTQPLRELREMKLGLK